MPVAMFAAALLLVAQPASGQEAFGLAVTGGTNEACVAMPGAAGSIVTLVTPGVPKVVVTATVEGASASCTPDKSAYYYLGYDVEPSCRQRIEVED